MYKLLASRSVLLLGVNTTRPNHVPHLIQSKNRFSKFKIKYERKGNEIPQSILDQPVAISVETKHDCLSQFKLISERFYADLYQSNTGKIDLEDRSSNFRFGVRQNITDIQTKHLISPNTISVLKYLSANLDNFTLREKAAMFNIFSRMNTNKSAEISAILNQLEVDFYGQDLSELSFLDYLNYRDGFYYHRLDPPHFFFSKALDLACQKILESLEKESKTELIPSSTSLQDPIDMVNNIWILNHFQNDPVQLITHFLRDVSVTTRDMTSILLTRLIQNKYRVLNEDQSPANINALVGVLRLYYRSKDWASFSPDCRELYLQLANNNLKRIADGFHLIKSSSNQYLFIKSVSSLLKKAENTESANKIRSYLLKELLNSNQADEFTWSLKCLGELLMNPAKNKKNLRADMFYVHSSIYSKLAESFASNESEKIRMKTKNKETANEQDESSQWLSRRDQRGLITRFETLFSDPSIEIHHLYDLIINTRLEFFDWIYRPLLAIFREKSENLIDQQQAGNCDLWNLAIDRCLMCAIRFKIYSNEIYLNEKILDEIYDRFIDDSSSKFQSKHSNFRIGQALGLILSHPEYANLRFDRILSITDQLIETDVFTVEPIIKALENQRYYKKVFPKQINDIYLKVYDKLVERLMSPNYFDAEKNSEEIYNKLFRVRSNLKFNSLALNVAHVVGNLDESLARISQMGSKKDTVELVIKHAEFFRQIAWMALLSDVYNRDLVADLLVGTVKLLKLIQSKSSGSDIRASYKSVINDLLTFYGVFNLFDYQSLTKMPDKWAVMVKSLAELKQLNESLYEHTYMSQNPTQYFTQLIQYNFSLLNIDFQFNQSINDMFSNIGSAEELVKMLSSLNEQRLELIAKLVYSMNQSLCIKHKDNKLIWLFEGYNALLPFPSSFMDIRSVLLTLVDDKDIVQHPIYEYGLAADFEITIDEEKFFGSQNRDSKKHRIPIIIFDKSYYYENLDELKRPIAAYARNFKKLYPLVIVNSDKLKKMQLPEKAKYIRKCLIQGLKDYVETIPKNT